MKIIKILLPTLFLIAGLILFFFKQCDNKVIILGDLKAEQTWVYLCGLTQDFNSPQEVENRNILTQIGKKLSIKFIALTPPNRCPEFDNKLCWPHNSQEEVLKTYNYILSHIKNTTSVNGFIGFSNGGFFLNQLAQIAELNKPIISIGAAGYLGNSILKNKVYLLIGTNDIYHYNGAQEFYRKSKNSPLDVELIEYAGGHEIPQDVLETVLLKIIGITPIKAK